MTFEKKCSSTSYTFLTPGTPNYAVMCSLVDVREAKNGVSTGRNSHGFAAFSGLVWTGFWPTEWEALVSYTNLVKLLPRG